jgi:hypothetical protein
MITETLRRIQLFAGPTGEQVQYVQQSNEILFRSDEYVKGTYWRAPFHSTPNL